MSQRPSRFLHASVLAVVLAGAAGAQSYAWRYLRPGNTGIQGDSNEALWVGPDGDPWIGGYNPIFEEGGVAKLVRAENRWVNVSNVDHPVIGHPEDQGCVRVTDITPDAQGNLWLGTWRGALRFDPTQPGPTLARFGESNSTLSGGRVVDVERAPDGSMFFSCEGGVVNGGLNRYQPSTGTWTYLGLFGGPIASQPRPGGGFYLWASNGGSFGGCARWDSTTGGWTSFPKTAGNPDQLISKDSVDDLGNMWILRHTGGLDTTLDCLRPDGTWISPPLPPIPVSPPYIAAVLGFGSGEALLVTGFGVLYRFDGSAWTSLGASPVSGFIEDMDIDAAGNVWMCAVGGAAVREVNTGVWQRYRVTNSCNPDNFNGDLTIDPATGDVYATANAASGVGGMTRFDGVRWTNWNQLTYGIGYDWPFLTDNSQALAWRASSGKLAVSPADWIYGVHEWDGAGFTQLAGLDGAWRMREDSLGRLWAIGGTTTLAYYDAGAWHVVPGIGSGRNLHLDPSVAGGVWAASDFEILRTDGATSQGWTLADFPGSAAKITDLIPGPGGVAWFGTWSQFTSTGSTLVRLDATTNTSQSWSYDAGWPFPGQHLHPVAVTPDGRVWMNYQSEFPSNELGLCWFDGTNVGVFPAPPLGAFTWSGLPHYIFNDVEVRLVPDGYELWISTGSRGIAVLSVLDTSLGETLCAGDGSQTGAACPCGNLSAAGQGCANSTGVGATLQAFGSASVEVDDLALQAAALPAGANGLVFMGGSTQNATPFGDGLRCTGSPIFRFALKNSGAGGAFGYGPGQIGWIHANLPAAAWIEPGDTRTFQAWYRDPSGPCGTGFNASNALAIPFVP